MYLYAWLAARGAVAGILSSVVQTGIGLALGLTGASPLPLGGIGGALVYLAAFSSKGVGTITLTEN